MSKNKIIIVGAGLCGSLLALRLGQRGFDVEVYERRADLRKEYEDAGRSINLALSNRGLKALATAGINEAVKKLCIPMYGRMIHTSDGNLRNSPYSGREGEYINSISRPGLNALLLDEVDALPNVKVFFDHTCTDVDIDGGIASFTDLVSGTTVVKEGEVVIGTDGAGSAVRRSMMRYSNALRFDYSQSFLSHGYKELSIPASADGGFKIEKNALHIWPRTSYMIIALPNLDGSFTVTMFHPYDGHAGFDTLEDKAALTALFETEYSDLLSLIPDLHQEYDTNPTSNLSTIKCSPWQAYGKTLIMGDASHAIVPFYGQGMNASFEDVYVFDSLLEELGPNWEILFKRFQEERIPNTNAIADLAIDNFYEMRDYVDDTFFIKKRSLEMRLEHEFPEQYYSKYSLVTFNDKISYKAAMERGRIQDQILLELCKRGDDQRPLEWILSQVNA